MLSLHALQVLSQHALQWGHGGLLKGGLLWGGASSGVVWSRGCLLCGVPAPEGVCEDPLPKADGYCCGRYASYWNAFLFKHVSNKSARNSNNTSNVLQCFNLLSVDRNGH